MYKKKKFPMQLFIFFENIEFFFWTSSVVKNNHLFCLVKKNFFFCMLSILKNELFLNRSSLIESSAIDLELYKKLEKQEPFFFFLKQKKFLCFFNFYIYFLKQRITFLIFIKKNLISIENLFSNSCWLEREISEMYGIFFLKKKDTRNLLLDYGVLENPLLKNFPCIGQEEVVYNTLKENVTYNFINSVEL